ncbi:hypothetical protein HX13_01275 [Chryseobacterium sp. P1-3]|nr:hypothetical protein HX13_01275 [Chryseobacterium sp. P1-3]
MKLKFNSIQEKQQLLLSLKGQGNYRILIVRSFLPGISQLSIIVNLFQQNLIQGIIYIIIYSFILLYNINFLTTNFQNNGKKINS